MTVNVDITALGAHKLYPAMIWLLTRTINEIPEFRMALVDGVLGVYDDKHPAYTVFNKESKTFSGIWTEFDPSYAAFLAAYECDSALPFQILRLWKRRKYWLLTICGATAMPN